MASRSVGAGSVISQVLTSWDGKWYLEIIRGGYPSRVPPNITYEQLEARAAFFPLFPWLARAADTVLPGGDTLAALFVNFVLGAISVVLGRGSWPASSTTSAWPHGP